jgi:hypothetical protein
MADNKKDEPNLTAWAFKVEGRKRNVPWGKWVEIGEASGAPCSARLDRLPIGGFNGRVEFRPKGEGPPISAPKPMRPGEENDGPDDESDEL